LREARLKEFPIYVVVPTTNRWICLRPCLDMSNFGQVDVFLREIFVFFTRLIDIILVAMLSCRKDESKCFLLMRSHCSSAAVAGL
jgi:hypothetical protein